MKKPTDRTPADNRQQAAAFRKAARELGADDSEERFQNVLRTIAKQKPESQTTSKKKGKRH
jgi:hypothetical protein